MVLIPEHRKKLFLMAMCLVVSILFSSMNGRVDMLGNQYGNYLYYYLAAFSGILFFGLLSRNLREVTLFPYLGRNGLIVLSTHLLLLDLIDKKVISFMKALNLVELYERAPAFVFKDILFENIFPALCTSIILILVVPTIFIFNRYLLFMLGRNRSSAG